MINVDENALICDLAETYRIYDYRQIPPTKVSAFSVGLRDNSRIKMKISGANVPLETMLLASIVDRLSILVWSKTDDARKGRNMPVSILDSLRGNTPRTEVIAFATGNDFDRKIRQLREEVN